MTVEAGHDALVSLVDERRDVILSRWRELLTATGGGGGGGGRIKDAELQKQCRDFLAAFTRGLGTGATSAPEEGFAPSRDLLSELSRSRAIQGFTPSETAMFVFSLKEPLFQELRARHPDDAALVADAGWRMSQMLDQLGLHTMEVFQRAAKR